LASLQVWHISDEVLRLQSHTVPADALHMVWQQNLLVTAPQYSGIMQVLDTHREREMSSIPGPIRRIDSLAAYKSLVATGEGRNCKLWNVDDAKLLTGFVATKAYLTALYLNDAILASGSSSGIVKLWGLADLLTDIRVRYHGRGVPAPIPLRRVSMKGVLHYPIKLIDQFTYSDLVIVAKYEARSKKDKIKVVQLRPT